MQIVVKLFGNEARAVGAREVVVQVDGDAVTAAELRRRVGELHPSHRALIEAARVAVNHDFASDDDTVRPGDEVALIGSVSGG